MQEKILKGDKVIAFLGLTYVNVCVFVCIDIYLRAYKYYYKLIVSISTTSFKFFENLLKKGRSKPF